MSTILPRTLAHVIVAELSVELDSVIGEGIGGYILAIVAETAFT